MKATGMKAEALPIRMETALETFGALTPALIWLCLSFQTLTHGSAVCTRTYEKEA